MFNFLKKSNGKETDNRNAHALNSDEYEKLAKRLVEHDTKMQTLASQVEVLETHVRNLRGNFNRKLGSLASDESESNPAKPKLETVTINNTELLPVG